MGVEGTALGDNADGIIEMPKQGKELSLGAVAWSSGGRGGSWK